MTEHFHFPRGTRIVVTGATGQDARFLIPMLLEDGAEVHGIVRNSAATRQAFNIETARRLTLHSADLSNGDFDVAGFLRELRPDYLFNLAGQSSVRESIGAPQVSWSVNADWTARLLEAVRIHSPQTRLYQASSSEMFGISGGVHDEESALHPVTPYAASKSAAHLLCGAYRKAYGLRIACGILFNHESKYRPPAFLTSKVASHVRSLQLTGITEATEPLRVGNLNVQRDWGYAAEFAYGILLIAAQVAVRSARSGTVEVDEGINYRDYVLATCSLTSVRELVDRAFRLCGFDLYWQLEAEGHGHAFFRGTRIMAVESRPEFFRQGEPLSIAANAARALNDLGWRATASVDAFLAEMLDVSAEVGTGHLKL